MIIGALPFLVGTAIWVLNPNYINLLFATHTGNLMIAGGATWMVLGVLVMQRMINFRI